MGASAFILVNHVFRRQTCRLCESPDVQCVLSLTPTPVADAYVTAERLQRPQETFPLDLFLCSACGHVQLLDVVDPKILFEEYLYVSQSSPGLVEHFRQLAHEILTRTTLPPASRVVDIGSNDGALLTCFRDRGMQVLGIDPAREVARRATESGLETWPHFFTLDIARTIREKQGPAALVTATNVFAHSDRLADMADGVRELLASDGIFVFEVAYLLDLVQKTLFDTLYHEHLCYHSVKPLQAFLRRHGLELFDVKRISSKGGSLRCYAQPTGALRKMEASVAQTIALEERAALDDAGTFRELDARIKMLKDRVHLVLSEFQASGKTLAGFGASPSVTTLVYHFQLGPFLDFIVDDNPRKQNTFSPGLHIPVLSPEALERRKPEGVLILAWPYAEAIVRKNQKYLDRGGRFIVPLPEPKILQVAHDPQR